MNKKIMFTLSVLFTTLIFVQPIAAFPIIIRDTRVRERVVVPAPTDPIYVDVDVEVEVEDEVDEKVKEKDKPGNFKFNSAYLFPLDDSTISPYMALGLGMEFWGIFEMKANTYFEVDTSAGDITSAFSSPEVISVGGGINIPLGGFRAKADYQRVLDISGNESELAENPDTFSVGVGIPLSETVELDIFYKGVIAYEGTESTYVYYPNGGYIEEEDIYGISDSFFGAGFSIRF